MVFYSGNEIKMKVSFTMTWQCFAKYENCLFYEHLYILVTHMASATIYYKIFKNTNEIKSLTEDACFARTSFVTYEGILKKILLEVQYQ